MNSCERVKRTIEFSGPDRLPVTGNCRRYESHGDVVYHFPKIEELEWWLGEGDGFDEWGCKWESIRKGDMGQVSEHPLKDLKDFETLTRPDGQDPSRYAHLEKELVERPDAYHIFCNGTAMFERMHFLRGFENFLLESALQEETFIRFAQWVLEYQIETAQYLIDHFPGKIHALRCTDDFGTQISLIMSPEQFGKLFKPLYAKLTKLCHDNGMHFWLHSCGKIDALMEDLIEAGVDVLNPQIDVLDLEDIGQRFAGRISFESYPDTQEVVPSGDREKIQADIVRQLKNLATDRGGYIAQSLTFDYLASACDVEDASLTKFILEAYRQGDPYRS